MNSEKRELYTIVWTQQFPKSLDEAMDEVNEKLLETSDFKEANDLINRIKGLDK